MKLKTDIILYSLLGIVLISTVASGLYGSHEKNKGMKCSGICITVTDSLQNKFISRKDVKKFIDKEFGGYTNKCCQDVSLGKLEATLEKMGCLDEHEAYFDHNGKLHVYISQITPVTKFISDDHLFYVDKDGKYFKVSNDWCSDCMEMKGHSFPGKEGWTKQIAQLATYLKDHQDWAGRTVEATSLSSGEIELRIDKRPEHFLIGQPEGIDEKLGKVKIYESEIVPLLEDGKTYKSVTLKYNGQIVCK